MILTFEPESPWEVGQHVTFHRGDHSVVMVVESIEESEDGVEVQYTFVPEHIWALRQAGVRPWRELE